RSLDEMKAKLPPVFVETMDEIASLTRHLNPVELYTADDLSRVKSRFLDRASDGRAENPKFTYDSALARVRTTLAENGTPPAEIEKRPHELRHGVLAQRIGAKDELARVARLILLRKIQDDLATIQLAHGLQQGDDKLVKSAFATKYGHGVDQALLEA